jgi:hypothetical protein
MNGDATPVTRAADFAAAKGIVVCNSAGNSGNNPWFFIGAPADADSILTVGGVDSAGQYVSFSSKGPTADGRVKPDVAAQAFATYVAELSNGGAVPGNGTSFSCPILAGMAACLLQCHPTATNMQIIQALRMSASQAANPDSLVGYGIPDVPQACIILSTQHPDPSQEALLLTGPNPALDFIEFTFHSSSAGAVAFKLTDPTGRILYCDFRNSEKPGPLSVRIPVSVRSGLYLLTARTKSAVVSKKIVML